MNSRYLDINDTNLSPKERKEVARLLTTSEHNPPELEDIWNMMDMVWDELGCDTSNLVQEKIVVFYAHPVWLLNGLFIEQNPLSLQHCEVISDWIVRHSMHSILDYGGGFGTLARMITKKNPKALVDIYEPYPHEYAIRRTEPYPHVRFLDVIEQPYDCLVCMDVLEHVSDPLRTLASMIDAVKFGGTLIIANNFYPVIKCHLPITFHLRYTFNRFAEVMGLQVVGPCEGSHATIYTKISQHPIQWKKIRSMERQSKWIFRVYEYHENQSTPWKKQVAYLIVQFVNEAFRLASLCKRLLRMFSREERK